MVEVQDSRGSAVQSRTVTVTSARRWLCGTPHAVISSIYAKRESRNLNASFPVASTMSVHKRDVERLYLQAIFSRGVVSEGVAKLLREKCIEAVNGKSSSFSSDFDNSNTGS
jgi:hypothetical protein